VNGESIDTVWLECPACRWRREYPQSALTGSMRCRKCGSTVLVSAQEFEPAIQPADELSLEPVDLPPVSGVSEVIAVEPEYQLAPTSTPAIPTEIASRVLPGSAPVETESDAFVRPPRGAGIGWAFTSNVLLFPWTPSAIVKWIFASLFSIVAVFIVAVTVPIAARVLTTSSLAAPVMIPPAIFLGLLSLSYLSGCLIDIVVNAAYNCDLATDWPESDIKERFWFLIRIFFLFVIDSMPAAVVAEGSYLATDVFWPVYGLLMFLMFPISLLAVLETDSPLTPISRPIFRSLTVVWKGWLVFYLLSALLLGAMYGISSYTLSNLGGASGLIVGPFLAAAIFIYGRLLGRLAWLILGNEEVSQAMPDERSGQPKMWQIGGRRDRQARQLFRGLP